MTIIRVNDRRQRPERRTHSERRRGPARCKTGHRASPDTRYAVFEVCRSMLHFALLVRGIGADGHDKLLSRSLRWRHEAQSLYTPRGVEELTEAFRILAAEERLAGANAYFALSGEFCVTRVVTGATDFVRRELAELEERSLRYLRLGPGKKILATHVQQLDARHQHALLTVANHRTIDVLMQIAEDIGIQPVLIEPSLMALSRAQAHLRPSCPEACLIVHLDEDGAELGICHGGRLLIDYRPGGQINAGNVAELVNRHLLRLQRYLKCNHSYVDGPLRSVYLAGDPVAVDRAREGFTKCSQLQVSVMQPADFDMPWRPASGMPGTELSATLGTAMTLHTRDLAAHGPNLIENYLSQLREPLRPILIRSLMPLAAVLLIASVLLGLRFQQWREAAALRAELQRLAPAVVRATELRLKLTDTEARLTQLRALAQQLPQPHLCQVLDHIAQSMPQDIWLDRLRFDDGHVAMLNGASYTEAGVYDFVSYLKEVPELKDIALEGTEVGQGFNGPTTNFNLRLTVACSVDQEK